MDKKRIRKTASGLLFRGGIDEGCHSGLDYFKGSVVTLVKHVNELINLWTFGLLFRIKEKIRGQIQCTD